MILIVLCFVAAAAASFYLGIWWAAYRLTRALRGDKRDERIRAFMHAEGWARVFVLCPCPCKRCSTARQDAVSVN